MTSSIAEVIRQRRIMLGLTLRELAARSSVSASHLARIERGDRSPSAHILQKLAQPLNLDETGLLVAAGYLSQRQNQAEEAQTRLDPYVAAVLGMEPVPVQRALIAILAILRSIGK